MSKLLHHLGVEINIEFPSYTVNEEDVTVEVCVLLASGTLARSISFTLTTSDGSATG